MAPDAEDYTFLCPPSKEEQEPEPVYRVPSYYNPRRTFHLPAGAGRHYQQQYDDLYFLRLAKLKPTVEQVAKDAWDGLIIAGEKVRRVDRVLDVRQGELCWVAGTVYMDLPMKPNILEDLSRENFTSAPPPRRTYTDPSNPSLTQIMMEDESGRLRLTGNFLRSTQLATGAIIAALGTENANGDFEVIDIKLPDLAPQPQRWEGNASENGVEISGKEHGKIAFVSGLGITGTSSDTLALELLTDYLLGYTGFSGNDDNSPSMGSSKITRLVIAGNSLGASVVGDVASANSGNDEATKSQPKKYGYDASAYNAAPITELDNFLAEILPSIPVTLMPGEKDPANFSLPQQGIHRTMFPQSRAYSAPPIRGDDKPEAGWFDSVTNPWDGDVEGWRLWGCSGQNVDDVLRYITIEGGDSTPDKETDSDARIRIMEAMLRWRCGVPTAPDTIWSYPFQSDDPYIIESCPHIFFAGNQPQFKTATIEGDVPLRLDGDTEMVGAADGSDAPRVRLLAIPKFNETGELILVDTETLEVEVVRFGVFKGQEEQK
ncbi:DNA polymerase alpha/epsilon, subunit B [Penicillium griseofulvum]|uniref:DNA-directed DNA polymerase n=1 Tax=Penicillium patulum TaxID=5078 RepID=A0A135LXR8_PENPA|nr:DNA polymerase alpha/epsilon, subunit B [Penicillium griseofulvum]KXG53769.1 DNA polymerase alpha/epsilon, subunit B [Penicillium griseofulvum]